MSRGEAGKPREGAACISRGLENEVQVDRSQMLNMISVLHFVI